MRVRKNTSSATLRAEKSCRRVGALDECKIERSRWAKRANTILSIRIVPIEIGSTCAELKYAVPHCRVDLVKLKISHATSVAYPCILSQSVLDLFQEAKTDESHDTGTSTQLLQLNLKQFILYLITNQISWIKVY